MVVVEIPGAVQRCLSAPLRALLHDADTAKVFYAAGIPCMPRILSDYHFAVQLNHFIPDFLSYSLAVFLK